MKVIFFCVFIFTLGVFCSAEEEGEGEQPCPMKGWMQFNNEMKGELCNPDKIEDKVLTALLECKSILSAHAEKFEKFKEGAEKMYEQCGTPNEADVQGYSKVDLTNEDHKKLLMGYCSTNMHNCIKETINKLKESGQFKKPDEADRPQITEEEKEQLKTCVKKALSGE